MHSVVPPAYPTAAPACICQSQAPESASQPVWRVVASLARSLRRGPVLPVGPPGPVAGSEDRTEARVLRCECRQPAPTAESAYLAATSTAVLASRLVAPWPRWILPAAPVAPDRRGPTPFPNSDSGGQPVGDGQRRLPSSERHGRTLPL